MVKETQPLQIKQEFTEKKKKLCWGSLTELEILESMSAMQLSYFSPRYLSNYPFFLLQTFLSSATYSSSSGGDTKLLAHQPRDIISSMCPGSTLGPVL